jgi:alpha-glucosidase
VAFRYVVPEQPSVKELRILNESTQFNFSKDANAFAATARSFQTSNEGSYRELTTSALRPEMLINIPLLLNVPDGSARTFPNVLTREGVMGAE